jgi:hypothetical protein
MQPRESKMHVSFEAEMPFLGPVTAFVEGDFEVLFDHVNDSWYIGRISNR